MNFCGKVGKIGKLGVCWVDDCDIWAKMDGGKVCMYDKEKTLSGRTLTANGEKLHGESPMCSQDVLARLKVLFSDEEE